MKKIALIIFLLLFTAVKAQEIENLPVGLITINTQDEVRIDQLIKKTHAFLENIYNPMKISSINQSGVTFSSTTWGEGSWGNGYFTTEVDLPNFNGQSPNYSGWYTACDYNDSCKCPDDSCLRNDYPSCRPMIREIGRIIVGYINVYGTGTLNDDTHIYNRILKGTKYLLDEQQKDGNDVGAFWSWRSRPNQTTPNSGGHNEAGFNNKAEQFEAGYAMEALTKAYLFFKKNGINQNDFQLHEILTSIKSLGDWFIPHALAHHNYYRDNKDGTCKKESHSRNTNQLSNSIWGLVNAYKVTKESKYLDTAIQVYEESIDFHQEEDGAWSYSSCAKKEGPNGKEFHDSQGHYTGNILRNLILLYDELFCEHPSIITNVKYAKDNLKNRIILTINHFLKENMSLDLNNNQNTVRLRAYGEIADYKRFEKGNKEKQDIDVEIELYDAMSTLTHSQLYHELSNNDQTKIVKIGDAVLKSLINSFYDGNGTLKGIGKPFTSFRHLSLYKHRQKNNFRHKNTELVLNSPQDNIGTNKIGIYNTNYEEHIGYTNAGSSAHLMTTGDFDRDGEDEIAIYSKVDGRISIHNSYYNSYTGCNPSYVKSIETGFRLHDHMEALDYDGDGYNDEIVMHNRSYAGKTNRIDILDLNGYISTKYSNAGSEFALITTGDFDKDGKDEIAAYSRFDGQISIYNPDEASKLSQSVAYTGHLPIYGGSIYTDFKLHDHMKALDYDGNGKDEIVMHNRSYAGKTNRIDILDLNGYISTKYSNAGSEFALITTGDFDKDGKDEIAAYSRFDGQISIYNPDEASKLSQSVAYTGHLPIYGGSVYTKYKFYTQLDVLRVTRKDYLYTSPDYNYIVKPVSKSKFQPSFNEEEKNTAKSSSNKILIYPNPIIEKEFTISFTMKERSEIEISLLNINGKVIGKLFNGVKKSGVHEFHYKNNKLEKGFYILTIRMNGKYYKSVKIICK
ncbi:T9SS type A sorting domain-containing protein [Aquimarina longa]|uniref:T9SS type A sorting domain-containing protein n=1 Tax=Aquimarina longa TaxID=1080221 RepID=UPI000783F3AE|nr:T9SS type A sorting domain-containing protein [Aquimarina longa]